MHLIRTVAPQVLPVSMAEVKSGAGLEGLDETEEARIAGLIRAATEWADGPDGSVQRALITQTWELRLDEFPGARPWRNVIHWRSELRPWRFEIEIPLPPLQSVDSVSYVADGASSVLDPAEYQVFGSGDRWKARIRPVTAWPVTDEVLEAVIVTFTAGYGDSWNDVPEMIRLAIISKVRAFYDGCEDGMADMLLQPYRVDLGIA